MKTLRILILIFTIGLLLLILPDKGDPAIQLNEKHGPSWQDLIGLILMLASWLILSTMIIRRWAKITKQLGNQKTWLLTALYFISATGIATGLAISSEWMLWLCIAISSLINILYIFLAFRHK